MSRAPFRGHSRITTNHASVTVTCAQTNLRVHYGPPGAGSQPTPMHAIWAQSPRGHATASEARAPADRPLTSLCCVAGPWSLVCVPSLYSTHPDLRQELASDVSIAFDALRHLVALAPLGLVCAGQAHLNPLGKCMSLRFMSAPSSCSHPHLDLVLLVSLWYAPFGAHPRTRRSRSPSAPRAPVLERSHSLSSHLRAAAVLTPPQPCCASRP